MRISWGSGRFVILVGPVAIKIMRLRPFWGFKRLLHWGRQGKIEERLRLRNGSSIIGVMMYPLRGWEANIIEWRLWRACPRKELMPTLLTFFGVVNIQLRGEPITEEELPLCPFQNIRRMFPELVDFGKPEHFCRLEGEIRFVDYGQEQLAQVISHVIWERRYESHGKVLAT